MRAANRLVLFAGHTMLLAAAALGACTPGSSGTGPEPEPTTAVDGRELVAPHGAPYTYRIPAGWVWAKREPEAPGYLTSVGPKLDTTHSNAVVSVEVLHPGSERQARDLAELSKTPGKLPAGSGWTAESRNTAAGTARLVTYRAGDGGPGGRYFFFDRPAGNPVFVMCQWYFENSATEALRGCDELVNTLTITN